MPALQRRHFVILAALALGVLSGCRDKSRSLSSPVRSALLGFHLVVDEPGPDTFDLPAPKEEGGGDGRVLHLDNKKCLRAPFISAAYAALDVEGWRVTIRLAPPSNDEFAQLSKDCAGKMLAIVVEGEILMAPMMREPITDGVCVITGQNITEASAKSLASKILGD